VTWGCAIIFWVSIFAVGYTFGGYLVVMTVLSRWIRRPIARQPITPTVSLIISAYNEEKVIAEKIENAFQVDYPREQMEIIIVADGSTDRTVEIVRSYEARGVRLVFQPQRRGKIDAMNRAAPFASGEVLVFSDADAMMEPQSVRRLIANFADPKVACVGGIKKIREASSVQAKGESAYWRYEAYLKRLDSEINTAIGAIGELFAIRRELWRPMETDLLIEDFVLTMKLVERGWRVVYEPGAVTWENASSSLQAEWIRRVRMAAGGFQAIGRLKGMLNPLRGFSSFQYISHKVLRWLSPFFMILAFLANWGLLHSPFYRWLLIGQIAFYLLSLVGYGLLRKGIRFWFVQIPFYFSFANAASLAGFWRYIRGTQPVTWAKAR
jgi:poly-beta-1,6-N-acetyl-D-glucosamine synthase